MVRVRCFNGAVCITIRTRDELLPLQVFGAVVGGEKGESKPTPVLVTSSIACP